MTDAVQITDSEMAQLQLLRADVARLEAEQRAVVAELQLARQKLQATARTIAGQHGLRPDSAGKDVTKANGNGKPYVDSPAQ